MKFLEKLENRDGFAGMLIMFAIMCNSFWEIDNYSLSEVMRETVVNFLLLSAQLVLLKKTRRATVPIFVVKSHDGSTKKNDSSAKNL